MRVLFSFLALIVTGVAVQAQQAAPAVRKNSADANQYLSARDKESLRIRAVMDWAKKAHPTQQQLMYKIYEPILLGCRKDYPKVQQMAQVMSDRADQASSNGQDKSVAKYQTAARLYLKLADEYVAVVTAFDKSDGAALQAAFEAIPKLEAKIAEATDKAPKRDWVLPTDFAPAAAPAAKKPAGRAVPKTAARAVPAQ